MVLVPAANYILSHVPETGVAQNLDEKTTKFFNKQLKLHSQFPTEYWHHYRGVRSVTNSSRASHLDRLAQVATHSTLKTLDWRKLLKNEGYEFSCNFNLSQVPSFSPKPVNNKTVELFTDASLQRKQGGGAYLTLENRTSTITQATDLSYPASSTNLEIQVVNQALLEHRKNHVIFYTDSLNTVRWVNCFLQQKTKKHFSQALNILSFLIKQRLINNLSTEVHHVYSHLLEKDNQQTKRKMREMKEKFGDRTREILKDNQKVDRQAQKQLRPLTEIPFDLFSPKIMFFDSEKEQSTYKQLHQLNLKPALVEKRKHYQLLSNSEVNWSSYCKLPSHLKDITIRAASSALWTRKRIAETFPNSPKITSPLCPLCKDPANHDHIFLHCSALSLVKNFIAPPLETTTQDLQRGLPDHFTKQKLVQERAEAVALQWKLHCIISWNNITSLTSWQQHQQYQRLIKPYQGKTK